MATPTLTVWSDYVCPWCYVGQAELESLRAKWQFQVDWRPFMLRPDAPEEGWPIPEYVKQRIAAGQDPLRERAASLGLTIRHRDVIPPSRRAHECTEFARAHGALEPFHHGVLERYWSRQENLADWSVLRAVATDCGLDADAMQREVEAGQWREAMLAGVEAAHELGVNAVPTFVVGGKLGIQGAQPAEVFERAFQQLGFAPPKA